jgi:hypothetical protein
MRSKGNFTLLISKMVMQWSGEVLAPSSQLSEGHRVGINTDQFKALIGGVKEFIASI